MSQKELKKANLLIYEDDKEKFLADLQEKGIFHITNSRSSTIAEENPDLIPAKKFTDVEAEEIFKKIQSIVDLLKPYSEGNGVLGQFIDLKTGVSPKKYKEIVENFDVEEINRVSDWESELYHLENKLTEFTEKLEFYEEWTSLKSKISEFGEMKDVSVKVYKLSADKDEIKKKLKDIPVDLRIVFEKQNKIGIIFLVYKGFEDELKKILADYDAEAVDFKGEEDSPENIVFKCKKEIGIIQKKISEISAKISEKGAEYEKYVVLYDYFLFRINRTEVLNKSLATRDVFFVDGWVEEENSKILQKLADEHDGVDLNWIEPEKGESVPVKLKNNPVSSPYEAITNLYALPRTGEIDPTPFIAVFFALFFAFCLTDAMYGFGLIIICLYLLRKLPEGRKYLLIFIGGGVLTLFTGAITGSWFGSNIEEVFPSLSWMAGFRSKLILFDPFVNPINFFFVSLGLGFVQIMFGLVLGAKEKIRKKLYLDAVANEISWITIFAFLILFIVTKNSFFVIPILLAAFTIILFSWRSNSIFKQILKGSFVLFNGGVGFLGNILSYSRIMALGLVTAGLAMSINVLAKVIRELVPWSVVGLILAVIIFIFGHLFSLAINTLGAFVHTMRLQFAEFFPYFYEGGGEVFKPFGLFGKYTIIEKKEVSSD